MRSTVLLMMPDDAQRAATTHALAERNLSVFEAPDNAHAMAALGRATFHAMVFGETRGPMSLKGLCLLSRKRHPSVPIFIALNPRRAPAKPLPSVGVGEQVLDATLSPAVVATHVVNAVMRPPVTPFDIPSTTMVWSTLEAAAAEQRAGPPAAVLTEATLRLPTPMSPAAPSARSASNEPVLMMGDLEDIGGGALIMTLLAQELTGVLHVHSGAAQGPLYFYRGDPVSTEDVMGDAGLFVRLIRAGVLDARVRKPAVPEGQMMAALVNSGLIRAEAAQDHVVMMMRQRVLSLAGQRSGVYRFVEDRGFLNVMPLTKVNAFGLVLESMKRGMTPARLADLSAQMIGRVAVAGPGLSATAARIRPFAPGLEFDAALGRPQPVAELWRRMGLDPLAGALIIYALMECRLVTLSMAAAAHTATPTVKLAATAPKAAEDFFALPDTEVTSDTREVLSDAHAKARAEILNLYVQLKPMTVPRQVLGLPMHATQQDVERAWRQRRAELDSRRVPPGTSQALLVSHLDELMRKVDAAYQVLAGQAAPATSSLPNLAPVPTLVDDGGFAPTLEIDTSKVPKGK